MTNNNSSATGVQYTLTDVNGQPVTVTIDAAQAQHLLQQFSLTFGWRIQWQPLSNKPIAAETLESFAQQVLQAADTVAPAGRFGAQQVFINHAWRAWQNSGGQLSLTEFKRTLLEARRAKLLTLGCAALLQTLNAVDVAQSEVISDEDVVYHFVVIGDR